MTQYNSLNVKLSNSQLNKLKSAIKNELQIFVKPVANHTSTDIKFSKAQVTKMQKGGFLRFLVPFLKSGFPLLKCVIKPLRMLGFAAAASATDAAINKKSLDLEH